MSNYKKLITLMNAYMNSVRDLNDFFANKDKNKDCNGDCENCISSTIDSLTKRDKDVIKYLNTTKDIFVPNVREAGDLANLYFILTEQDEEKKMLLMMSHMKENMEMLSKIYEKRSK